MKLQLLNKQVSYLSEYFYLLLNYVPNKEIPFEDFVLKKAIVYDIKALLGEGKLDKRL